MKIIFHFVNNPNLFEHKLIYFGKHNTTLFLNKGLLSKPLLYPLICDLLMNLSTTIFSPNPLHKGLVYMN